MAWDYSPNRGLALLLAAFLWRTFLWVSYGILAGVFSAAKLPVDRELVGLLCVGLFSYTALITCGIDMGKAAGGGPLANR